MAHRVFRPVFDHGQFWADLVEDLADPEFREAYTDMSLKFMQEFHEEKLLKEKIAEHYGELHDTWEDCTGRKFYVHKRTPDCDINGCAIHNPSYHPLSDAPQYMREDRGFLIERVCEHGTGHPDPDSASYMAKTGYGSSIWVHGCDGCCQEDEEPKTAAGWGPHVHQYEWFDDDNGHSGSYCLCGAPEPDIY